MNSLIFRTLHVRRMPGITDGGFELDTLSPGLNVVYGPNASGKTTTASAIAALLWPHFAPARAWLSAGVDVNGSAWNVRLDGGHARWQCDGVDASAAVLPAEEARDRYRISLHELLAAEDAGFAQAIARESAGGFDLVAAARALDPRTSASRCTKEVAALNDARARLRDATGGQEALFEKGRQLRQMEERLAGRQALSARIRLLEQAVEHARAREAAAQATLALGAFDSRLERLHGNEAERLRALADKIGEARNAALAAAQDEQRAGSALASCRLPETGLPGNLLPELRRELAALREQEHLVAAQEQALRDAEVRRQREQSAMGVAVAPERLRDLSVEGIGSLADFAREAEQVAAKRTALQAQLDLLSRPDGGDPDVQQLERGAWLLRQWLRSGSGAEERTGRLRSLARIATIALIVACLGLALIHPALGATALLGVVILVLISRVGAEVDPRPVHQAEFSKTGLAAPTAWTDDAVEQRLAALDADAQAARRDADDARRGREISAEIASLSSEEDRILVRRQDIAERLGVEPSIPIGSLVWLLERIGRWHSAHAEAEGAAAALGAARDQLAERLQRARIRVAEFTEATSEHTTGLAGVLEDLEQRQVRFSEATHDLQSAREKRTLAERTAASLEQERAGIFADVGLTPDETATLDAWCAARAPYLAARQEQQRTATLCAGEAARLTKIPGFGDSLLTEDEGLLSDQIDRLREETTELDRLQDEATEIRTRVSDAKQTHAVEEALADLSRCKEDLRRARERDLRSVMATALIEFVQGVTRDQHLPAVFHRARELFVHITHGRFRLDFDDGQPPAFRAFDTTTGVGHPLEELSSATRIQLLMAVRLAFVETQEQGVKLPLLFDETLGNSDDGRATAIMDALLELVAEGRQVFYFTAQPDEVGKWKGLLEERDGVAAEFIDLGEARRLGRRLELPGLRMAGVPAWTVPAPEGRTRAEYREMLGVPPLDAFAPLDTTHLWYLVEEPEALHRLLSQLRVERWGALRSLVELGAQALVDPELYARTAALARALDTGLTLWQIGRGRPVDRSVLEASGAITESFLDAVDELCREYGGDARQILDALERGDVKRFRSGARETLQEYLEGHGYLDDREVVDSGTLRFRMMGSVANELGRGLVDAACIDWLLARLEDSLRNPILAA